MSVIHTRSRPVAGGPPPGAPRAVEFFDSQISSYPPRKVHRSTTPGPCEHATGPFVASHAVQPPQPRIPPWREDDGMVFESSDDLLGGLVCGHARRVQPPGGVTEL